MLYLPILIVTVCAAFFWRAAEVEGAPRWLWGGLSFLISAMLLWLRCGIAGIFLGQIGLFFGIAIFRFIREK